MTVSCCVNLSSLVAKISTQFPSLKAGCMRASESPLVPVKGGCSLERDRVIVVTKNVHNTTTCGTDMCLASLVSSCLSIYTKTQKETKAVKRILKWRPPTLGRPTGTFPRCLQGVKPFPCMRYGLQVTKGHLHSKALQD